MIIIMNNTNNNNTYLGSGLGVCASLVLVFPDWLKTGGFGGTVVG